MAKITCSLNHEYEDTEEKCPVCGEKRPAELAPVTSGALIVPDDAFVADARPQGPTSPIDRGGQASTSGSGAGASNDDVKDNSGSGGGEQVDDEAELVRVLDSPLPTIAVVGYPDVGKSFFIQRLNALAKTRRYKPDNLIFTQGAALSGSSGKAEGGDRRSGSRPNLDPKAVGTTKDIHIYEYWKRLGTRFRVVDIPGEFFSALLGEETDQHGDLVRLEDVFVERLLKVIASAEAFIVLVPARELRLSSAATGVAGGVEILMHYLQAIRDVNRLLDRQLAQHNNDLAAAIAALGDMSVSERRAAAREDASPVTKPFLLLYSKADEILGAKANIVNPVEIAAVDPNVDCDPMLASAQRCEGFLGQLCESFTTFKIDFVTAYEGLPKDGAQSKIPDNRLPHRGVWEAITWTLRNLKGGAKAHLTNPMLDFRSGWDAVFASAYDPDRRGEATPKPGASAGELWKPLQIWLRIYLPAVVAAVLAVGWPLWTLIQMPHTVAPDATAQVHATLEQVWTDAEHDQFGQAPFFHTGLMANDVCAWDYTPTSGMGSVNPAARREYNEAIAALRPMCGGPARDTSAIQGNLNSSATNLGDVERVPILYHDALRAYLAGDDGPARALLEGEPRRGGILSGVLGVGANATPQAADAQGALNLIERARPAGRRLSQTDRYRLDGEEIAVRRLLGHIMMRQGHPDQAEDQFQRAIAAAGRAANTSAYRRTATRVFQLRPQTHLISLSTGALWNDLIAARLAQGQQMSCRDHPRETYCPLYDETTAVKAYPPLAVSLAMLAARDGRSGLVSLLSLPALPPPEPDLHDDYALARRAVGLASPPAIPSRGVLRQLAMWDWVECQRSTLVPELGAQQRDIVCREEETGGFGRRWRAEFQQKYATLVRRQTVGDQDIASDPRIGIVERWWASEPLHGRWPGASLIVEALLLGGAFYLLYRAWRLNHRYDDVFRPIHYEARKGASWWRRLSARLVRLLPAPRS